MKGTEVECCDVTCVHEDIVSRVWKKLPREELLNELADFYKVFADSTRVKILCVLLESEMCVCDLADCVISKTSARSQRSEERRVGKEC